MPLPPPGDIAIVVAGALAGGFVNGLTGTGYALVALGFWLQAMSPVHAAPLVAFCSVVGHLQSLPSIWHGVRWPRLWSPWKNTSRSLVRRSRGSKLGSAKWQSVQSLSPGVRMKGCFEV